MRPLRVAIFGLIVLGIVSVRADTWPWPAVGAQARVRREDLVGRAPRQHFADALRGVVDRVALGHLG